MRLRAVERDVVLGGRVHAVEVHVVLADRVEARAGPRAEEEHLPVDLVRARPDEHPPHALADEHRLGLLGEHRRPHARPQPVGADDDVVAARAAVAEADVAGLLERVDGQPAAQPHPARLGPLAQDVAERRPRDPDRRREVAVREADHRRAREQRPVGEEGRGVDLREPALQARLGQAEHLHRAHGGREQQDADPAEHRLGLALDEVDLDTRARELARGGHAGDPGADDQRGTGHASTSATARVQPAEARAIFTGKQTTVKPSSGSVSRLWSFSSWQ